MRDEKTKGRKDTLNTGPDGQKEAQTGQEEVEREVEESEKNLRRKQVHTIK